jgi:hypothetical protein
MKTKFLSKSSMKQASKHARPSSTTKSSKSSREHQTTFRNFGRAPISRIPWLEWVLDQSSLLSKSWLKRYARIRMRSRKTRSMCASKSTFMDLETLARLRLSFKRYSICNSDISSCKEFISLALRITDPSLMRYHKLWTDSLGWTTQVLVAHKSKVESRVRLLKQATSQTSQAREAETSHGIKTIICSWSSMIVVSTSRITNIFLNRISSILSQESWSSLWSLLARIESKVVTVSSSTSRWNHLLKARAGHLWSVLTFKTDNLHLVDSLRTRAQRDISCWRNSSEKLLVIVLSLR